MLLYVREKPQKNKNTLYIEELKKIRIKEFTKLKTKTI